MQERAVDPDMQRDSPVEHKYEKPVHGAGRRHRTEHLADAQSRVWDPLRPLVRRGPLHRSTVCVRTLRKYLCTQIPHFELLPVEPNLAALRETKHLRQRNSIHEYDCYWRLPNRPCGAHQ